MRIKIYNYLKYSIKKIIQDDFGGMASEMAYMLVLAIFPFMTFLVTIFGMLGKKSLIVPILAFLKTIMPLEAFNIIESVLNEVIIFDKGGWFATFALIITIVISSSAIAVIIKGLNKAYGIKEHRSFITTRLLSVLMLFANTFLTFLSINLIIFGQLILKYLFFFTDFSEIWLNIIAILRWPLAFLFLYFMAALNYYILPALKGNENIKRKSTLLGTLFFCTFWLLGSSIFSIYVNNLNTYNRVYGTIGGFAMLMIWLFYTSFILLLGGDINSQVYKKMLINQR